MGGRWLPVGAGVIMSYCLKNEEFNNKFKFHPTEFRQDCLDITEFHNILKDTDIIGFTCYIWNQDVNDKIAQQFKQYRKDGIVIYGGPNVPENFDDANEFAQQKQFVDIFFIGPGEKNFLNYLIYNSKEGTYSTNHYNISTNRSSYQVTREETPTPFQDGIFDEILKREKNIGIPLETTRGCPYSCAFCDWGSQSNSKIVKFDEEVLKKEIKYFTNFDSVRYIDFCDANYGIFERDVDIIKFICENKNQILSVSFSGFAKNGTDRISEIHDLLSENFSLFLNEIKISLQTMSNQTLATIKRSNIKTKKLISIVTKKRNNQLISGELIIGLPGETANSWLDTLCKTAEIGIDSLKVHRLLVLPNTLLNDKEYIKNNNIIFKDIKIPTFVLTGGKTNNGAIVAVLKNYPNPEDLKVESGNYAPFEKFKTIISCNSFDFNEFLKMHEKQFWYNALIGNSFLIDHMKNLNIDLRIQSDMFFDNLNNMPFFKSLKDSYINNIKRVLIDDKDGVTYNYLEYFSVMMNKNMEAHKIYKNLNTAISEIKQIYPTATFDHIRNFNNDELLRLASVYGTLKKKIKQ